MAKLNQAEVERVIKTAVAWTYFGLCDHFNADHTQKMQIDRTLQKLRRKGEIRMEREGRTVFWYPVITDTPTSQPAKAAV